MPSVYYDASENWEHIKSIFSVPSTFPMVKCLRLIPDSNLCEHNKSGAGAAYLLGHWAGQFKYAGVGGIKHKLQ